jgi:hypothetical protein
MALEITHIDDTKVDGILDGAIDFSLRRTGGRITATIGGWTRDSAISGAGEGNMRCATYEILARYREAQRENFQASLLAVA